MACHIPDQGRGVSDRWRGSPENRSRRVDRGTEQLAGGRRFSFLDGLARANLTG